MIVFPMAGLSARFARAGYDRPKYMLPLGGRSMLAQSVLGFSALFGREPLLFVCRDVQDTPAFLRHELAQLPVPPQDVHIAVLDRETAGQAETVHAGLAAAGVDDDSPLTIFNIDSQRRGFAHPTAFDPAAVDGYLEVFRGPGTHWSFVRPAGDPAADSGRAAEVAEKIRISDLCSSGLYHFRRAGLFRSLFEATLGTDPADLQGGERYIAPLYNAAIAAGHDIRYVVVPREVLSFTGTPDEYEALRPGFADLG